MRSQAKRGTNPIHQRAQHPPEPNYLWRMSYNIQTSKEKQWEALPGALLHSLRGAQRIEYLVCDFNLWLEKDRDFVVMGQITLFGRITGRDNRKKISFSSKKVLSFGQRSPRNRDEWYTSSPSDSVTLQWFGHLEAPVEPITGAKDLSVIRKPTSR